MTLVREVVAVINSTVVSGDRAFVVGWAQTRLTLIRDWDYFRVLWRGANLPRPPQQNFGAGLEDTFHCVCNRVLPVVLAQADHVMSREEIPNMITFQQVQLPHSPGPIRQRLTITLDDNDVLVRVTGTYIVEYQINPATAMEDIGRFSVDPGTGIVRAKIWDSMTHSESIEVFEFVGGHAPNAHTKIEHPGDSALNLTIASLLEQDMCNLQLMCGPCNASKNDVSYYYFEGQQMDTLFNRGNFSGRG